MPLLASNALSPFNKPDADVVLRSLDGVEFLVRSHILIEASPCTTLDILLRICYPIPKPKSDRSIADIETALRVAVQYQLELPITVLEDELVDLARRGFALEVWALACRMKREALARRSVESTFDDDKFDVGRIGSMQDVSAGDYFRFREYRRLRGQVCPQFELCRPTLPLPAVLHAPISSSPIQSRSEDDDIESYEEVPHSQVFLPNIPHPDLVCIASDGAHLPVHRMVAEASSVISAKLSEYDNTISCTSKPLKKKRCKCGSHTRPTTSEPPKLSVEEEGAVLNTLFQLCYPDHTLPTSPSTCLKALVAAGRLGMVRIVADLGTHWQTLSKQDPLRAYFAAVRIGQSTYAEDAAKYVVQTRLDGQYIWEMETIPALPYHLLTAYYDQCRAAAKALLRSACISPTGPPLPPRDPTLSDAPPEVAAFKEVARRAEPEVELWLQEHLGRLYAAVDEHPGQMPPGAPEALFERASVSGHWCRSIPSAVGMVKFKW
ncbi:hypothetical protein K466DRAFT_600072 [Polyporus arcularius HHB13444]|uniref:BTB domain-containing protein n=1 Tax=Polyporus arcularius HHB13444 TaxID=1314778 RepID=A0A5C3PAK4_9APHY|nr:hypothetical protein K466DRAFT_600072 [Polyporus arcularius HHB13444]